MEEPNAEAMGGFGSAITGRGGAMAAGAGASPEVASIPGRGAEAGWLCANCDTRRQQHRGAEVPAEATSKAGAGVPAVAGCSSGRAATLVQGRGGETWWTWDCINIRPVSKQVTPCTSGASNETHQHGGYLASPMYMRSGQHMHAHGHGKCAQSAAHVELTIGQYEQPKICASTQLQGISVAQYTLTTIWG